MSQRTKKIGTIGDIKNIDIHFTQYRQIQEQLQAQVIPSETYLVAVSGGADSMLTACLVYKFRIDNRLDLQKLILVHCNHKTRAENEAEAKFLEGFMVGAKLHICTRTTKLARLTEESLRKWRYGQFQLLIKKYQAKGLILGHNLTDRIESSLLNMLRGAHLNGFLAMRSYELHHILKVPVMRPLLALPKAEVTQWCTHYGIPFVTDPSNADLETSRRNKIRHTILPQLYTLAHKPETFLNSRKALYAALDKQTQKPLYTLKKLTPWSVWKARGMFEIYPTSRQWTNDLTAQLLQDFALSNNMQQRQIAELTKFFASSAQGYKYVQGAYFWIAHGKKYLIQAPELFWEKSIEKRKKISMLGIVKRYQRDLLISKPEWIGGTLRFAHAGDRYHGKTRNQYCITAKIPVFWRNAIPVIIQDEKIVHVFKEHI